MLAPNISATVLALRALVATGRQSRCASAMTFLERCQNYSPGSVNPFDDGGFFFAIDDPIRNKAGVVSADGEKETRFRSYGSATCDGLIGLQACGVFHNHPRWLAAADWLKRNVHGMEHAGAWPHSRAAARESLVFYYAQALADTMSMMAPEDRVWATGQGKALAHDVVQRQDDDGSCRGRTPDRCEDDAILATAFAVRPLAAVRS
jgi:hypothetical protein